MFAAYRAQTPGNMTRAQSKPRWQCDRARTPGNVTRSNRSASCGTTERLPAVTRSNAVSNGSNLCLGRSAFADAARLTWRTADSLRKPERPPSECSTRVGSSDSGGSASESDIPASPAKSRTTIPVPLSVARDTSIIIFDWDDTLLPTSWLKQAPCTSLPSHEAELRRHAQFVEETLRAARSVAKVGIVTLAKESWLTRSAERCLPGLNLASLLADLNITVYYAREESCLGALRNEEWAILKRSAMERCITDFYVQGCPDSSRLSVLSIGDSVIEQQALKQLISAQGSLPLLAQRPLCKTLKLMEFPTLRELSEELRRLTAWLQRLSLSQRSFDVSITNPSQLDAKSLLGI